MSDKEVFIPKGPGRSSTRRVANYAPGVAASKPTPETTLVTPEPEQVPLAPIGRNTTRARKNYAPQTAASYTQHEQECVYSVSVKRKSKRGIIIACVYTLVIGAGAFFTLNTILPSPGVEDVSTPDKNTIELAQTQPQESAQIATLSVAPPEDKPTNAPEQTEEEIASEDVSAAAATTEEAPVEEVPVEETVETTEETSVEEIAPDVVDDTASEEAFNQAYLGTWVGRWSVATSNTVGYDAVVFDAKSDYTFSLELLDGTVVATGASWSPVNTSDGYTHVLLSFDTAEVLAGDPWCTTFISSIGVEGFDLVWDPNTMTYTNGDILCLVKTQ